MFRDSSDVEMEHDIPMPVNNVSDGDGDGDTSSLSSLSSISSFSFLSSTRDSEENQHPLAHDSQIHSKWTHLIQMKKKKASFGLSSVQSMSASTSSRIPGCFFPIKYTSFRNFT